MKFEIKKCLSLPIIMLFIVVGCTSSDINNNIPVNSTDLIDANIVYKSETVKVDVENAPLHSLDKKIEEHNNIDDDKDIITVKEEKVSEVKVITPAPANEDEVVSFVTENYKEEEILPPSNFDSDFENAVKEAEAKRGIVHPTKRVADKKTTQPIKSEKKIYKLNIKEDKVEKQPSKNITFLSTIIYHSNAKADISSKDKKALKSVADFVRNNDATIKIVGNSSSRSKNMKEIQNKIKNFELSLLRAQNVRDVLIKDGVPANKISIVAASDTEKVIEENMPINEAINRRTEIYINY